MDNFATASIMRNMMSLRTDLPISVSVYSIEGVTDVLGYNITDDQWQDIFAEFEEQSEGLMGALSELFKEVSLSVINRSKEN